MSEKEEKGKKSITIYLLFFLFMIAFIAIAPFVAINQVEKRTALPAKERIK